METKIIIVTILLVFTRPSFALIGEDAFLLFELVTTTASQLNELEKLVTNAEKYTARMQQYNELIQDEYYKAERIAYLAEEIVAKKELQNLGDLNHAIRGLKYNLSELKDLMREYAIIKDIERQVAKEVKIKKSLNKKKKKRAGVQVTHSINAKTTGRSTQLTAQNTALIHETQIEMADTQLDVLKGSATTNRLLAEQMEEKRVEQIKKAQTYKQISKRQK